MSLPDPSASPTFFEVLGAVAQSLSADREEADNLTRCLKTLVESSQASLGVGLLQGPGGLTAIAEYGSLDENTRLAHFTLARLCLETGQAVAESHADGWMAATPLVGIEETFGVLAFTVADANRPPQPFLSALGRLVGSGLDASRRYAEMRTAAHRLERLNRLTTALTSGSDLAAVVAPFAEEMRGLFDFDRLACGFVNDGGDYVELVTYPAGESWGMGAVVPLVGSGLGHSILEAKPVLQRDILHSHRFIEDMKLLEDGIRSYVVLPLVARGKSLGVVALGSKRAEAFETETLLRLQPLISHLALAFDNVHLMQRMRDLSITDEVTPLFNHRFFHQMLERELKFSDRYKSQVSIAFIDLDHFKPINDVHGHLRGSHALREVGFLLRTAVRETDYPARYGGDEFVIILPQTDGESARVLGEKFRELIEGHTFLQEEGINASIGASVGIATYPDEARTKPDLIRLADKRMYEDKASRKTGR
ncbi:MAG: diguanylate cyclase [Vicinamibacteria bacterium]